jgi:hypothetical protein
MLLLHNHRAEYTAAEKREKTENPKKSSPKSSKKYERSRQTTKNTGNSDRDVGNSP